MNIVEGKKINIHCVHFSLALYLAVTKNYTSRLAIIKFHAGLPSIERQCKIKSKNKTVSYKCREWKKGYGCFNAGFFIRCH